MAKKIVLLVVSLFVIGLSSVLIFYKAVKSGLPEIISVADYKPLLVSPVYDRGGKKVGEFYRERRTLVPYEKMPQHLIQAFLAAEDDQFFKHGGINYGSILRATIANIRAGHSVQGGSTITQQLSKTLLLRDSEKTLMRKFREALLATEVEKNLKKEEILYLYLNQIYFGHGAYGVQNASQTYFKKSIDKITLEEAAILAGLPQAPSRYSPVSNPSRAKERQLYVLKRMADVGFITREEAETASKLPVKVYIRDNYDDLAPFYMETVRQILVDKLGEKAVLDEGITVQLAMDLEKQIAAQDSLKSGLKDLDKRQGFRGPLKNMTDEKEISELLEKEKKKLILETNPERTILPDGQFAEVQMANTVHANSPKIPGYMKLNENYQGVVKEVNDVDGYVIVQLPGVEGIIDFESMKWARKPNSEVRADLAQIQKPSEALHVGDIINVDLVSDKVVLEKFKDPKIKVKPKIDLSPYVAVHLDQEPLVEGAIVSFDQRSQELLALVGGYDFRRNEFNRALQAARQTGSSFKTIVYASALDKGYTPSTPVMDVPIVYEEKQQDEEGQEETKVWKPSNHGREFSGEIIFRNALVQSLNIPTVKIIEDVGVSWAAEYAKRLGIFSPLNMDFTLALGSSSVTLYEMTKVFSEIGRLGKRVRPIVIKQVKDHTGQVILENVSLDVRFQKELEPQEAEFEEKRLAYINTLPETSPQTPSPIANPPSENKEDTVAANETTQEKTEANPKDGGKTAANKKPTPNIFFADPDQLIKPQTAYILTSLLKGVVEDPKGTGARARAVGRDVAGKTGTTNGYFDAWFIGYSAQVVAGVWVGFDKERSLGRGEVGGRSALPIWVDYMKSAHEQLPQMTLPVPEGIVFANIDGDTGKLANAESKRVAKQAYLEGTEPTTSSNKEQENNDFLKQDF
jgi:penicillin-binding protein 1A